MNVDAADLVAKMVSTHATVATAESLTGGQLASIFTAVPGSSECFLGGVVAYETRVKVSVLGVDAAVVEEHGVVSAECAAQMATRVRTLFGATYGLATTGVAGPTSQEGHPPGHVWVACAGPEGVTTALLELAGDRAAVQARSCRGALTMLGGLIHREDPVLG
ncbi:CinA family protein [Nocardioides piscis]|uniref:CinA family protein n=1 Tax=Nocardioides piscis TaxID=2714938 RepID=A0A6G7YHY2_9ACTN|nr:CinA family protein [Nocardioides piscis]QIK76241.1 CinA family protein [Nocardioides piscis]